MTSEVVATHVTKRGASFSEAEQVSLTHSWIEVSLDPIHGNDQKGADFYKRVSDIYKVKMGRDYTVRSPESLHGIGVITFSATLLSFLRLIQKQRAQLYLGINQRTTSMMHKSYSLRIVRTKSRSKS